MNCLIIEEDAAELHRFADMVKKLLPDAEIKTADNLAQASIAFEDDVDLVFLDVAIQGMSGLEFGRSLLLDNEKLNLIYVTENAEYALEAFQMHASGYLIKPVDELRLTEEIRHLRYRIKEKETKLKVQCLGNFEVFYKDIPIHFPRTRSKEVLAYLIDRRGASASIDEMCSYFWDNTKDIEKKKSYVRTMIKTLRKVLDEYGLKGIVISQRNSYAVNPALLECDYYNLLENPELYKKQFQGEYMSQYSWSEHTLMNLYDLIWD